MARNFMNQDSMQSDYNHLLTLWTSGRHGDFFIG